MVSAGSIYEQVNIISKWLRNDTCGDNKAGNGNTRTNEPI